MKNEQLKRSISLLLCMVMVLSLMPMSVLATDGGDSDIPEWITNTVVYINGQDVTTIDEGDDTISWDAETKTLTLNNASILAENGTHKGSGIYVVGADTVVLELKGESTVEGKFNGRIDNYQYVDDIFANAAISTVGNLVIRGEGILNATDLPVEEEPERSAGIYAGGELTIEGGTINATGCTTKYNDSFDYSAGIISGDYSSWGTMRITGGTVNATGGTYGITTYTTLMISGGTVNAIANSETGSSGIYTPDHYGGFEYGGVHFSGGTTTMSGPDSAVTGLTHFQNFGVYKWKDTPDGAYQYSGLDLLSGMTAQYLRIEPSEYSFVAPSSSNRFTADVQYNDGETWGSLPENVTAEYKWYRYNERFLTDEDFDESTAIYTTYDAATGLWTIIPQSTGDARCMMGIAAEVGDIVTLTMPQKPSGVLYVASIVPGKLFEERSNGVFTHTVTEADLDPETGLVVLYLIAMNSFQYTLSLSDTEEVQTAADKPNQFISDIAGKYMCTATVYQDGASLGTFTSDPFAYTYTGWKEIKDEGGNVLGTQYHLNHVPQYTGWTEIDGEWYYLDPVTGYRAEGITRLPYPTASINGVTYAPDQDALDYCASKGTTFIDAEEGWFYFDENGIFVSDYTGINSDSGMYFENGFAVWHPGIVLDGEDYYYFTGDSENGGNKLATGDIYVSQNTTQREFVVGGVYTFDEDGILCEYDGITEVNGVLRYYEDAQLMLGKGLVRTDIPDSTYSVTLESYSDSYKLGTIKVVRDYLGLGLKDAKELVESAPVLLSATLTKEQAEALVAALQDVDATVTMEENRTTGYIYVTSDGSLVVNANYWVAKTNGLNILVGAYDFDENGRLIDPIPADKSGVYFENGAWYYYENGKIGYNKGLIYVDTTWYGADGSQNAYTGYIYVRSSGKLATDAYYITNVENDNSGLFIYGQRVVFSDIGIADMPKHGIVDVNGTLYFYQYNAIKYNAGLIEWNGGWIYVRSNGKVAIGNYWITNTNGEMDQGMYEFGTDGYMIVSDVEDGIVSADGKLYYYEGGKKLYGVGLKQLDDGSYIYIRSNGQLAVGSYWITNHNDLLPEDVYIFGDDGILTEI